MNSKIKKIGMVLIGSIFVIVTILLVIEGHKPEFFDIFGVFIFAFLFIVGIFMLVSRKKLPDYIGFIILLISILGLIVDGSIVIKNFILGG